MPSTYTPIATNTLGSATASVTFSSISGSYTDIVIQGSFAPTAGGVPFDLRFNGDTTTNYSVTRLENAGSNRSNNLAYGEIGYTNNTNFEAFTVQLQNYSNATTFKTYLARSGDVGTAVYAIVGLWRKTPEAINSITIRCNGSTFVAGSTFTLYGVKSA